jgi:hypothetical protein
MPFMPKRLVALPLAALALFLVACSTEHTETTDEIPAPSPPASSSPPVDGGAPARDVASTPTPSPATPEGWGAAMCPAGGDGFAVGDVLGEVPVRDCLTGETASLKEVCGASATWIFAAHTHCPTCQATASYTDDVANALASKNVATVQLVYDDNGTSCAKWRDAYKLGGSPHIRVYEDKNGQAFNLLKKSNYTAAHVFLNKDRKITFKEHGLSKANVLARIEEALVAP